MLSLLAGGGGGGGGFHQVDTAGGGGREGRFSVTEGGKEKSRFKERGEGVKIKHRSTFSDNYTDKGGGGGG